MSDQPINFVVGKWYRTRDGRKVRCVATDGEEGIPFVFVLPRLQVLRRGKNGQLLPEEFSNLDILGPWIDRPVVDWSAMPAWANWVAMDGNGDWFYYASKPNEGADGWYGEICYSCTIPSSYAPTFSGDWKDSLCERPAGGATT